LSFYEFYGAYYNEHVYIFCELLTKGWSSKAVKHFREGRGKPHLSLFITLQIIIVA